MSGGRILYIPGLLPKPEYELHRRELHRCLLHSLRGLDPELAAVLEDEHRFDILSWTHGFYGEHRDIALDQPSIDACLEQTEAADADRAEVDRLSVRIEAFIRRASDYLPWLIPYLAGGRSAKHIEDLDRYARNIGGAADEVRAELRDKLLDWGEGDQLLVIAHSMGSVIAWDTLWEMTHRFGDRYRLNTLFTMGSPLGQWFVRRQTLAWKAKRDGGLRYPDNIGTWHNLSARGDMTSSRPRLAGVFSGVADEPLTDTLTYNWFRLDGELNPHAEYGYLANRDTAETVARWWRKTG